MDKPVLIVEDAKDIRDSISASLSMIGIKSVHASHGQEALDLLSKMDPPALILLDIMMPVMDGWEFREHQQKDARIADVPVVVLTADGSAKEKAIKMGASLGVKKPLDLSTLFGIVKAHCRG